ncbi:hypothetical protein VE01_09620 [Pseudogymnoascus verrucosus]|uniref:Asteroid domain-containing protein n=1 Tax=Pseudogymnoascus verrucosus TaxID=342668 RepID=A0A1B8G9R6_9PEZI|nr:uncharacterized protein VE01_09620 [Pseudogymnoascus verrucosus]OBT92582.1 hypothetical protein VE01_09620 [Pseudogymnoascus verrucosus]
MGIPHLITHLRPYSENTNFNGQNVIIDGPGFAYHIFHTCLAEEPEARNPFEAFPSYKKIGDAAIRWLEELEGFGVEVKKIYFDGFLPASKKKTRSSRLMNYTKQLALYHEAWPQVIPSGSGQQKPKGRRSSMFDHKSSAAVAGHVPAIPFLVPAILEKLLASERFQSITSVSPGEADLYCARYVKEHGGTVLTGDSDLLVHDLGALGSVSFFKDLEVSEQCNIKTIRCCQYTPALIVERLDLNRSYGLKSFAFEMVMDPHASLPKLKQKSKDIKAVTGYPGMYTDFVKEYEALPKEVHTTECTESSAPKSLQAVLSTLDPRISEYVLQFPRAAEAAERPFPASVQPAENGNSVDMFLPFLLDCPSKTSAWEMSTAVRQLAYGVMNLTEPKENHVVAVVEHRRQQKGSRGREWQLPTYDEIDEASAGLVELAESIGKKMPGLSDFGLWRAIGLHQDLVFSSSAGKQSLGSLIIESGGPKRLSWDTIHFSAQLQGSFYSFRMLKQILEAALVSQYEENLSAASKRLSELLKSLPELQAFPDVHADLESFKSSADCKALSAVKALLNIRGQDTMDNGNAKSTKKDKKNKRKRAQESSASVEVTKRPNNMFDLLGST